jgi:FkbM family methyltransferase
MKRARFDWVEVLVAAGVIAALAWRIQDWRYQEAAAFSSSGLEERASLQQAYGTVHASQSGEEWIIRDFFKDRRGGTFLDVGANDYKYDSNTYYLETSLGWHGVAIDAQPEFAEGYRQHRPQTQFFALFVSDVSDASADFFVPTSHPENASSRREVATIEHGGQVEQRHVPTVSLNDLLTRAHLDHVDFLNMDIELGEPKALAGLDLKRYKPALVCIEAHPAVRQDILDYFQQRDYVLVGKYLRMDTANLYFKPE